MDFIHPQKTFGMSMNPSTSNNALQPGKGGDVCEISLSKSFGHLMDIYTANPWWA